MDNVISYDFAVLRYRHDLVTDEFINIGVIMFIKETKFLYFKVNPYNNRLRRLFLLSLSQTKQILKTAINRLTNLQEKDDLESIDQVQRLFCETSDCFTWSEVRSGFIEDPTVINVQNRLEYQFDSVVMEYY